MSQQTNNGQTNIFLSLLGVLFIGLKLTGHITWSWWYVLLPLYAGLILVAIILIIALFVGIFKGLTGEK